MIRGDIPNTRTPLLISARYSSFEINGKYSNCWTWGELQNQAACKYNNLYFININIFHNGNYGGIFNRINVFSLLISRHANAIYLGVKLPILVGNTFREMLQLKSIFRISVSLFTLRFPETVELVEMDTFVNQSRKISTIRT